VDGVPQRNRYRRFRIRSEEGLDDAAGMAEVIRRRFRRLREENSALPDLLLVDGGVTQVGAARRELRGLGLSDVAVAGLAKRFEEIHGAKGAPVIRLPRGSQALQVLQRLRDEAHRFALTYHRRLRGRRIRESVLDGVPGIGAKRKRQLLDHFGSVYRLARAEEAEIAAVPGIGPATARVIREALIADTAGGGSGESE
jgi:excinuclease ABC subunit C